MQNLEQLQKLEEGSINEYPNVDPNLIEEKTLGNFSFLEVNTKINPFKYKISTNQTSPSNFYFLEDRNQYTLIIPMIIEKDNLSNSKKLRKTINSLYLSLPELIQIGITNQNILICLFFLHFSSNKTFSQIYPNTDYLAACCTGDLDYNCSFCYIVSSTGIPINIISFNKNDATPVECLKCFYLFILNDIKFFHSIENDEKIIYTNFYILNWENGIIPENNSIVNLIKTANEPMIIFPAINSIPNNLYGEILHFYFLYLQLYSYYYYDMTCSCPIEHKFNLIRIDKKLYEIIKHYFTNFIYNDAEMLYHDYKFGVYLQDNGYNTYYINQINVSFYEKSLSFNDFMMVYSKLNSSYILIFIDLLRSFFLCQKISFLKIIKKIFLFFQILSIIIDFAFIGFSILIIFCSLSEAFIKEDNRIVHFFIGIYVVLTFCSCCFSLISPSEFGDEISFLLFHLLFYLYFIFFIICSLVAISKISENEFDYNFNKFQMAFLLLLNVFIFIIPSFFHCGKTSKNILSGIKFFILIFPGIYSVFRFHYLINCIDLIGQSITSKRKSGNKILYERKKTLIFLFFLTNSIFCFFAFFLTTRTRRMIFIFFIGILFTTFNGISLIAIVIGIIKLFFRKRYLIKFMVDELNFVKNETRDSLSVSIEEDKKNNNTIQKKKSIEKTNSTNIHINITKDIKTNEMSLEQLKEYFGDLETNVEFSNMSKKKLKVFFPPKRK